MRKIIITTIISALIVAVGATFGVLRYTQASTVTPYDADVDHDGQISILDLSSVARYYGQAAPLATATALPQPHESEITLQTATWWGCINPCEWLDVDSAATGAYGNVTSIDASQFPADTQFYLQATIGKAQPGDPGLPICLRLGRHDGALGSAAIGVAGSDVCLHTGTGVPRPRRVWSVLTPGRTAVLHVYRPEPRARRVVQVAITRTSISSMSGSSHVDRMIENERTRMRRRVSSSRWPHVCDAIAAGPRDTICEVVGA